MVKVLVLSMLVACGTDDSRTDRTTRPDAGLPQWSCRLFVDCAGSAQTIDLVVAADSETAAETSLADECDATTCAGALACHAVCEPLQR